MRMRATWSGNSGSWIGTAIGQFPADEHDSLGTVSPRADSYRRNRPDAERNAGFHAMPGGPARSACYTIGYSVSDPSFPGRALRSRSTSPAHGLSLHQGHNPQTCWSALPRTRSLSRPGPRGRYRTVSEFLPAQLTISSYRLID